jgi:hypothetical protein
MRKALLRYGAITFAAICLVAIASNARAQSWVKLDQAMQRVKNDVAAAGAAIRDCDNDKWVELLNAFNADLYAAYHEHDAILYQNSRKSPEERAKLHEVIDPIMEHLAFPKYPFPCYPQTSRPAPRGGGGGGGRFGPRPSTR